MATEHLTAQRLREILHYDQETGIFTWLVWRPCKGGGRNVGDRAGCSTGANGYREIGIDGASYFEHRLAWLYMTGTWPNVIDHRDRCRSNNKFSNLRDRTYKQNQENRTVRKDSISGEKGVYHIASSGKWRASIKSNRKLIHIGCFATKEDAVAARQDAERMYFTNSPACEPSS